MACLITRSWIQIWRSKRIAKYGICPVKGNYQVYVISSRLKHKWLLELSNQFGKNTCIPSDFKLIIIYFIVEFIANYKKYLLKSSSYHLVE